MRSLSERQRSAQCYSSQELQDKNHWKAMAIYKLEGGENADDKQIVGSEPKRALSNAKTTFGWKWSRWWKIKEKSDSFESFCLTFIVWQLTNHPGWLVSVQANIQDITKLLWVQITSCSNNLCWRQATLPPGNMGHDVHWNQTRGGTALMTCHN